MSKLKTNKIETTDLKKVERKLNNISNIEDSRKAAKMVYKLLSSFNTIIMKKRNIRLLIEGLRNTYNPERKPNIEISDPGDVIKKLRIIFTSI